MQIKLLNLKLQNFKSITDFTLNLDGKSATISAQNAAGKTTLADGFFWLLTGADSAGRAKFGIITQDAQGDEKRGLDAVVSAYLESDRGKIIRIERRLCQKWTKKRGQAQQEFGGHETKFSWDEVPVKKKEFETKLSEIVPLNLIRVLADVHFFNDTLKSEDRRNILLDLIGSVGDGQIIDAYPELKSLPEILDGRSPEDVKKILAAQRKAANDQLKEMPIRIDTLKKTLADAKDLDLEDLEGQVKAVDEKIDSKKDEIRSFTSGLDTIEKKKKIKNLELKIADIEADVKREVKKSIYEIEHNINNYKGRIKYEEDRIKYSQQDIIQLERKIDLNAKARKELILKYRKVKAMKPAADKTCFACGAALSDDKIAQQQGQLEQKKAEEISKIDQEGANLYNDFNLMHGAIKQKKTTTEESLEMIEKYKRKILDRESAIDILNLSADEIIAKETIELKKEVNILEKSIENFETDEDVETINFQIDKLNEEKKALQYQHARAYQYAENQKTIEEYEAQLSKAAVEFETAEHALYTLEQYSMRRAEFVEDSVSDKFLTVKWRLFDTQINQGIKEICEATVGGIDYSTNLNTGAKINAGLDCINVLSQHYGIELPIFVDNAESVTSWLDSGRQIIRLVADGNHKKLEVNNATTPLPADN